MEPSSEGFVAFLGRHPTMQFCVLAALGALGVYISMPIGLDPQSRIEWIDLFINMAILVPSSLLAGLGGALAILSGASGYRRDQDGAIHRLSQTILRRIGIPRILAPDFTALGPLGLLLAIVSGRYPAQELSDPGPPSGDSDSESQTHLG